MYHADVPLWTGRAGALIMAWAWSILAFGVAINAYVESRHDQHLASTLAPPGAVIKIEDGDVFKAGAVILAVCLVIFVITSLYLAMLLIRPASLNHSRFIAIQAGTLAFFATWLFAVLVPYTHFVRTRSAIITASIGGQPLPQSIINSLVQSVGRQSGLTPRYRDHGYLRLVAILPWFTLLFTIIASTLLYVAASRAKELHHTQPVSEVTQDTSEAKVLDGAVIEKTESA